MDNNNWRPPQVGEPAMDAGQGDWRSQLQPDSRKRIVNNKIMDTLKRHLPFSGEEGLQELKKIAVRFEEKIYAAATSQSDYLRKISLKMLTMETRSQNAGQSNSAGNSNRPPDPASWLDRLLGVLMDNNNGGPPEVAQPAMDVGAGDWRSQLQPDSRQRVVNKIMESLKRYLPFLGREGLQELKKIAVRLEDKAYSAATSQSDYLRKISLKMLAMETESQKIMVNAVQSEFGGRSNTRHTQG